jgi:hypothetical protein
MANIECPISNVEVKSAGFLYLLRHSKFDIQYSSVIKG